MADFDRYRSFCERYIIARASQFRAGQEREDAWNASLDALSIYRHIEMQSRDVDRPPQQLPYGSTGVQSVAPNVNPRGNLMTVHQKIFDGAMAARPVGARPVMNSNSWTGGKK